MSKIHANMLDTLASELVVALASDSRRLSRSAPEVKQAASALKEVAALAALNERDAEVERSYRQRVGRLSELGKLSKLAGLDIVKYAPTRKDDDGIEETNPTADAELYATAKATLANIDAERSVLFGQPIDLVLDLDPQTGRFIKSARFHQYGVGMLALDPADIVSAAIELCYRDERALTIVTVGWDEVGKPRELTVPTVGGMFRAVKKAHRLALNEFRMQRKGLTALHSLDALKEAGVEPGDHFDHYGVEYADEWVIDNGRAYQKTSGRVQDVSASRRALREAQWREEQEDSTDEATMRERMLWADKSVSVPNVLRVAVKMLAAGATLADTARKLGVKPDSLIASIKGQDWAATA